MIAVHMHLRKTESFWCSIRDAKDTLVTSKWKAQEKATQLGNQLVKQELLMMSKKSHLIKSI